MSSKENLQIMKTYKSNLKNEIEVYNGNIEDALKRLRKDSMFSGTIKEIKARMHYTKPSLLKKRANDEIKRQRDKQKRKRDAPSKF